MHRPPGFRYRTGNRLELLAERLAGELGASPLAPHLTEQIVVPSSGMGSWLKLQLARRWGIAASVAMPFPARFLEELSEPFGFGRPRPVDPFASRSMLWELQGLLYEFSRGGSEVEALDPVLRHLRHDDDGRKRYQLARRLSALFWVYQFQRPKEILRWSEGGWFRGDHPDLAGGEDWQRELWLRLRERHPDVPCPAERLLQLIAGLGSGALNTEGLPARVSVFAAGSLPPVLVQAFGALAQYRPVDLYTLVPTAGYFADLLSRREREQQTDELAFPVQGLSPAEELVGELGRAGREFFQCLLDLDTGGDAIDEAGFEDPGTASTLHQLQSAMLAGPDAAAWTPDPEDRSLRVHSCHSPLREMEVLRDEVLRALAEGAAGSVSDVLLLVPDIRLYAPLARGVFGGQVLHEGGDLRLAVRVADHAGASGHPFARLLLRWMELAGKRLTLSEVFEVLHEPAVHRRFDLDESDLDRLRDRLRDAGVVWGTDPADRARRTGTPEFAGVSWREGLDRLLLGCMVGPVEDMVGGILPAAEATMGDAAALGRLDASVGRLFEMLSRLEKIQSLAAWVHELEDGLLALTDATDESSASRRAECIDLLEKIIEDAGPAGSAVPMGRLAFLDLLRRELSGLDSGAGFVSGAITIAELRPMRSLPAAVIAVAGMDADSFPRRDLQDGLDLVGRHRRRGDRSPRDDDRQLFLELLLSARERLIFSYVGRSEKDNKPRTLSPCVQEVLDTLGGEAAEACRVEHPLQPFAGPVGTPPGETFDHGLVKAAAALDTPGPVPNFVDTMVVGTAPEGRETIALEDLRRFWKSPAQWFCKQVVGMALMYEREEAESEGLCLNPLQRWSARDHLIRNPGMELAGPSGLTRLGLPANDLVRLDLAGVVRQVELAEQELGLALGQLHPQTVRVEGSDWTVEGELLTTPEGELVEPIAGSGLDGKYLVQALVSHAVAGAAGRGGLGRVGVLENLKRWKPFAAPAEVLEELVRGWRKGQIGPLPFYPRTSLAFAKALEKSAGADPLEIFRSRGVQSKFEQQPEGNAYSREGEREEEAVALCTRGLDEAGLCSEEFRYWADCFHRWHREVGR